MLLIWLWVDRGECNQTFLTDPLILLLQHSYCLNVLSVLQLFEQVRTEYSYSKLRDKGKMFFLSGRQADSLP